ncbi:MAG: D-alanyl-D-alanine carboxypeptidase [Oscillospiraceae bacterium]|nr:D-alanyl-D-alanine carboxypeptidase [Oscillospiraceae bacterium]
MTPVWAFALEVSAEHAILIDADSGRALYSKNAGERADIASTTKIMTAFLALQTADTAERVTIKREHTLVEGTRVYFKEGDVLTVEELLVGTLLQSGNDAALALADHCGGSEGAEGFVRAMNDLARQLGMENTSFANPHGLNDDNHYSTAEDMAILTRSALNNAAFAAIVSRKTGSVGSMAVRNHNRMLWNYEGSNGVKTGYTKKAGRCLVSSAERGGQTLIAVTLNAPSDWNDHTRMLDFGFNNYPARRLATRDAFICELPVVSGVGGAVDVRVRDTLSCVLTEDETRFVRGEVELPRFVWAPVGQGETVGLIRFTLNGEVIGRSELYAAAAVPEQEIVKRTLWARMFRRLM